jgi:hypothetical protein
MNYDDDELWVVECEVCTYQATGRVEHRINDRADEHEAGTGHKTNVFSEDR